MGIVSSEIVINRQDGIEKRFIREIHTDSLGIDHQYDYNTTSDITQTELDTNLVTNANKKSIQLADSESKIMSDTDNDIIAGEHAKVALVVLAYLRKAYSIHDSYTAYKKFVKFNNYRVSQGWSTDQVVTQLTAVGLTQEEWDLMLARYTYLSNAQRVTAMENYQLVLNGDPR